MNQSVELRQIRDDLQFGGKWFQFDDVTFQPFSGNVSVQSNRSQHMETFEAASLLIYKLRHPNETIQQPYDFSLPENFDLLGDLSLIRKYLSKGQIPPLRYNEYEPSAVIAAIYGKNLACVIWALKEKYPCDEIVKCACKSGTDEILMYFLQKVKKSPTHIMIYIARFQKPTIDYILTRWPKLEKTQLMFEYSTNWEVLKYVCDKTMNSIKFTRPDVYRQVENPEHIQFLVAQNAPKDLAVCWYISDWQKFQLLLPLEPALLYRAAEFLIDNEKVPVENFKRLLDLGLGDFHELVHNQRGIDIALMFCKVEDPRLIKSMFLAGHWPFIHQVELPVAIEQCIKEVRYDLLAEITADRKISYYTLYLGDVEKAREYGFKLHRSVAKELGYCMARKMFEQYTVDVEDDEDGWWARQVQIYNEFTFKDIPDSKEINRLIVFSNYETLKEDGFYYPNVLYDIIDVQYLYEHKYSGKNCGPYAHDFEPEWTDQIKTFYWDGNDFSSGRDGGCLNCGGNYFVKVL